MADDHRGTPAYSDTEVDAEAVQDTEARIPAADTEIDTPAFDGATARREEVEMAYAEGRPPLEHTQRVAAARRAAKPSTEVKVHDETSPALSSSELAEATRKTRRRERDRRAESAAVKAVVGLAIVVGLGVFVAVNSDVLLGEHPADPVRIPPKTDPGAELPPKEKAGPRILSSKNPEPTPDIPALRSLASEGLTIGAEGLPKVTAADSANPSPMMAALETCRFAYGVWEFSPNQAFRFLTTCEALKGQVLVGAYEIDGSIVRMSPLRSGSVELLSSFHVARPSRLVTEVSLPAAGGEVLLRVEQKITALRPGMDGEGFRQALEKRNTIQIGGGAPERPAPPTEHRPPPPPEGGKTDPVLELLKGGN